MNSNSRPAFPSTLLSPWVSLGLGFFLFVFAGALSGQLLNLLLQAPDMKQIIECPEEISTAHLVQFRLQLGLSLLLSFGLAAWVWARMQGRPAELLALNRRGKLWQYGLACLLILTVLPFLQAVAFDAESFHLPESFAAWEEWIKTGEANIRSLTLTLLYTTSPALFILNVLVMAVAPAIAEEMFFRGLILNTLRRPLPLHLAVWLSAAIFSLVHFQFLGFFPRMVLGALLGYVFVWSGSLWVSIGAHFFNNVVVVLVWSIQSRKGMAPAALEDAPAPGWTAVLISLGLTLGLLYYFYKNSRQPVIPEPEEL